MSRVGSDVCIFIEIRDLFIYDIHRGAQEPVHENMYVVCTSSIIASSLAKLGVCHVSRRRGVRLLLLSSFCCSALLVLILLWLEEG